MYLYNIIFGGGIMKKCPECGEIGDDSSIFCQNCGNKLESIENRTVKNTPQVTDSSFEKIQTIKITVMKPEAPIKAEFDYVAVITDSISNPPRGPIAI
jgi:uncharacterized Zn finger protein (UPF0148 family)